MPITRAEALVLRLLLFFALVVAVMVAIKDGRVLEATRVLGSCSAIATPAGETGSWQQCRPGKLDGLPDLSRRSCVTRGVAGGLEHWRCPAPIAAAPGRR